MCGQDVATALQLLNFVKRVPEPAPSRGIRVCICVDWKLVETHATRVANSKSRIKIDPEALRWTPLVYSQYGDEDGKDSTSRDGSPVSDTRGDSQTHGGSGGSRNDHAMTSPIRKTPVAAAISSPGKAASDSVKSPDKKKRKREENRESRQEIVSNTTQVSRGRKEREGKSSQIEKSSRRESLRETSRNERDRSRSTQNSRESSKSSKQRKLPPVVLPSDDEEEDEEVEEEEEVAKSDEEERLSEENKKSSSDTDNDGSDEDDDDDDSDESEPDDSSDDDDDDDDGSGSEVDESEPEQHSQRSSSRRASAKYSAGSSRPPPRSARPSRRPDRQDDDDNEEDFDLKRKQQAMLQTSMALLAAKRAGKKRKLTTDSVEDDNDSGSSKGMLIGKLLKARAKKIANLEEEEKAHNKKLQKLPSVQPQLQLQQQQQAPLIAHVKGKETKKIVLNRPNAAGMVVQQILKTSEGFVKKGDLEGSHHVSVKRPRRQSMSQDDSNSNDILIVKKVEAPAIASAKIEHRRPSRSLDRPNGITNGEISLTVAVGSPPIRSRSASSHLADKEKKREKEDKEKDKEEKEKKDPEKQRLAREERYNRRMSKRTAGDGDENGVGLDEEGSGVERKKVHLEQQQPPEHDSASRGFKSNELSSSSGAVDKTKTKKFSPGTSMPSSSSGLSRPKSRKIRRIKGYKYWGQIPSHAKRKKKPVAIVAPSTSSSHISGSGNLSSHVNERTQQQQHVAHCDEERHNEATSNRDFDHHEDVSCGGNGHTNDRSELPSEKETLSSKKDSSAVVTNSHAGKEDKDSKSKLENSNSNNTTTTSEKQKPVSEEKRAQQNSIDQNQTVAKSSNVSSVENPPAETNSKVDSNLEKNQNVMQQQQQSDVSLRFDTLTSANDPGFSSRFDDYDMPSSVEDMNGIDDDDGSDRDDFVNGNDFVGTNFEDLRGDPERPKEADSDSLRVIPSGPSSCNTVSDDSELSAMPQHGSNPGSNLFDAGGNSNSCPGEMGGGRSSSSCSGGNPQVPQQTSYSQQLQQQQQSPPVPTGGSACNSVGNMNSQLSRAPVLVMPPQSQNNSIQQQQLYNQQTGMQQQLMQQQHQKCKLYFPSLY